ncbi:MFS transporter [Streptomyces sp. NPDC005722]
MPASPSPTDFRGTRNTAVLVGFTAVTNLADGVTKMALPLLAVRASGSPLQVTAVSLTLTLPWLLVALPVGVLVDRRDRRGLLWVAGAVRMAAVAALAVAAARGGPGIGVLCVAGAVLGVAEVVALTAEAALVPSVVPPAGRERANAWITGAETVCNEFCGPLVGGLLIAVGTGFALGATWAAYALASLALFLLAGRVAGAQGAAAAADRAPAAVRTQIAEGLRHLWRHDLLRTLSLVLTVLCACWGAWLALMPLYATHAMGLDAGRYGLLLSALGLGGLTGALTVGRVNRLLGRRGAMSADIAGTAAMMALPALTTALWPVAVGAFLGGMGGTLWAVNARTIAQDIVPERMMGRYSAVSRLFSWGAMPLGAALAGGLAELGGPRTVFTVLAVLAGGALVPFLRIAVPARP